MGVFTYQDEQIGHIITDSMKLGLITKLENVAVRRLTYEAGAPAIP